MQLFYAFVLSLLLAGAAVAQQPFAIKPYSVTLPRVTTGQQTSPATVPQQAGNMVYNTEQQAVAVHNGSGWGYLGAGGQTGDFKNAQGFYDLGAGVTQIWTIPAGVNQFLVEAWGGGTGGGTFRFSPNRLFCTPTVGGIKGGGAAGGYIRRLMTVMSGASSVSITVGAGGQGINRLYAQPTTAGNTTTVRYNSGYLSAFGGSLYESGGSAGDYFTAANSPGSSVIVPGQGAYSLTFTYDRVDASNFILTVKGSNGGLSYGAIPGQAGEGTTFVLQNGTTMLAENLGGTSSNNIAPGVGGGCGYDYGSSGGDGLVIIRW